MPRVGPSLQVAEKTEAAFAVVTWAVSHHGTFVSGETLTDSWSSVQHDQPPLEEVVEGRWERLLTWAIRDGRVTIARRGRRVFFGLASVEDLPLPEPPSPTPRAFGAQVMERAEAAERALDVAYARLGRHATGQEVANAWPEANGCAAPADVVGRMARVLEPGIAAGRVVATRETRHVYYAPATAEAVQLAGAVAGAEFPGDGGVDRWPSDLMRVEEAARRATVAAESAVRLEMIEDQVERDPALALRGRTPLGVLVQRLLTTKRVTRVHPRFVPMGLPKRTVYYSVPGGPTRVRVGVLSTPDRRLAALHHLWRASGGRPMSTAALRRYAEAREAFTIVDDPEHGWTNALQVFERAGVVTRIPIEEDERYVLWAPSVPWQALTDAERAAQVRDAFGRATRGWEAEVEDVLGVAAMDSNLADDEDVSATVREAAGHGVGTADGVDSVAPADAAAAGVASLRAPASAQRPGRGRAHGVDPDAPRHDVRFLSRNRDVRALVATTKRMRAAECGGDDRTRRILAMRPVTVAEVAKAAHAHAHLAPHDISLAKALHEASRVRAGYGMLRSSVVRVGIVGDVVYYDLPPAPARAASSVDGHAEEYDTCATVADDASTSATTRDAALAPTPRAGGHGARSAASAYVAHLQALAEADPMWLERDLGRLRDAYDQDTTGLVPLGKTILHARGWHLARTAEARAARIEVSSAATDLLPDEANDAALLRVRLLDVAAGARALLRATGADDTDGQTDGQWDHTGCPGDAPSWEVLVLDTRSAAAQLASVLSYSMGSAREITARFVHSVATVRVPEAVRRGWSIAARGPAAKPQADGVPHGAAARERSGRPVEVYLDRVGFACHLTPRFALGAFGPFAAKAQHALGALRDPRPFAAALRDSARKAVHAPALAALGFLDDADARDTVAMYLQSGCEPGAGSAGGPTTGTALPMAVLALAPKPFGGLASGLRSHERVALDAATRLADDYTAALARTVLHAWDDAWDQAGLLRL